MECCFLLLLLFWFFVCVWLYCHHDLKDEAIMAGKFSVQVQFSFYCDKGISAPSFNGLAILKGQ